MDAYGHFHIPTQINDLIGPLWKEKSLQTYNFKRIFKFFLILHLSQQQQRSRPCETCLWRDLVQDWQIPAFIWMGY